MRSSLKIKNKDPLHDIEGFKLLASYLHKSTGIFLPQNDKNIALMAGRQRKILHNFNLEFYSELMHEILSGNKEIEKAFIEAMTTNTTFFFREPQHFDFLAEIVPEILEKKTKKNDFEIRVWCAAASTGAEPYSLAMLLSEAVTDKRFKIKILATDIDTTVLNTALEGVYPDKELENIPEHFISKFFSKGHGNSEGFYRVKKEFRQLVSFAEFNLLTAPYPFKSKFDFIFCRNVFIYFETLEVTKTIEKMEKVLEPDGYLFVGHSEALVGTTKNLLRKAPAVYQKASASSKKTSML